MSYLKTANFSGRNNRSISLDGITIRETEYNYDFVDWHYHEKPPFTLITQGNIKQGSRRETYECAADTLLFHNCDEPHYTVKPAGITRGFQLEIDRPWSRKFDIDLNKLPAIKNVTHPNIRLLFYNIYKESKVFDTTSTLTIDSLLLETFETMRGVETFCTVAPGWVKKIDEILRENIDEPLSLRRLSRELDVHWAHLSRDFRRYFRCTFSQYVRKIKVEKSLALLRGTTLSLVEITFMCGFADQSHFVRCFKEFTGVTPKAFRRIISS
jgi:AraC family transcriptional regulator